MTNQLDCSTVEHGLIQYNHRYKVIGGIRLFFCVGFQHAYKTDQNFDYCPSCGLDIRDVKEIPTDEMSSEDHDIQTS